MKKIMKKNQVIITSLAILIAVAGYLNFADVDLGFKDKETSTDSSSILDDVDYDLTDETALLDENGADGTTQSEVMDTASPGEAVLTGASDFAAQAKVSREQVRSQNKADLQAIISNKDISEEEKQNAINTMVSMTDLTEKEAAAELLLEAKGFENVIVNLTGETADVVVPDADLEDAKRAQIEDIVKRKTGVAAESIVITPLSQSKNASDVINTADEAEKIREVQRIMRKVQVRRCRIPLHLWKAIRRIKHLRTQRRLQISRTIRLLIQREFTTELP
ncbi:SpoIIIAH-like family protein [Ruminococcus sp. SR1/5]|uniref:SpoIIIAH-like family protein n=1 Tax=Ruminococcus sp. SR1/5 TaxID=657323 RepID=UPI0002FA7565